MSRSRVATARDMPRVDKRTVASSAGDIVGTAGALAAAVWLRGRGVPPPTHTRWHVEIALDVISERAPTEYDEMTATRFHLDIYKEEWGLYFCHAARSSWIRVTDIAFVHGRDDFHLLGLTPPLKDVGMLLRGLEQTYALRFQREHAAVKTNLPSLEPAIRSWVASL